MPLPSPEAYRRAQLAARAAEGALQSDALLQLLQGLEDLGNGLTAQMAALGPKATTYAMVQSRQIIQSQYNQLLKRMQNVTGANRAASFKEIRRIWEAGGREAAATIGIDGATLGRIRAPALTMMGAYEGLGGAAGTWRTLLQLDVTAAAQEANALVRNGLLAGIGPDELGRQLRPYVTGAEDFQGMFKRVSTLTGDVRKLDLRTIPRDLRGSAKRMVNNSNRIAFSELHNARLEAQAEHFNADPLIGAIDWIVAQFRGKSAKVPDECDVMMTTDWFGLGPGRYPVHAIPREPHPWGRCEQRPVTRSSKDMKLPKPRPKRLKKPKHDPRVRSQVGSAKAWNAMEARAADAVNFGEEAIAIRAGGKPLPRPRPKAPKAPRSKKPLQPGQFTTRKQAEQWAQAQWPHMGFDFGGCDMVAINETLTEFEVLCADYPAVAQNQFRGITTYRNLKPRGVYHRRWGSGTWAHATHDGWIGLNPKYFGKGKKFAESIANNSLPTNYGAGEAAGSAWHPQGLKLKGDQWIRSVMTHEFGHQVDNFITREIADLATSGIVYQDGTGLVAELVHGWRNSHLLVGGQRRVIFAGRSLATDVSRYATTNGAERFAESFTQFRWGNAQVKGRSFVKAFGRLLNYVMEDGVLSGDLHAKGNWTWFSEVRDFVSAAKRAGTDINVHAYPRTVESWALANGTTYNEWKAALTAQKKASLQTWNDAVAAIFGVTP